MIDRAMVAVLRLTQRLVRRRFAAPEAQLRTAALDRMIKTLEGPKR